MEKCCSTDFIAALESKAKAATKDDALADGGLSTRGTEGGRYRQSKEAESSTLRRVKSDSMRYFEAVKNVVTAEGRPVNPDTLSGKIRIKTQEIVSNKYFDGFILALILLNSILLALYQYRDPKCTFNTISDKVIDPILLCFFTCELVLKVVAWGFLCSAPGYTAYLLDPWNWLDAIVVVTGWISLVFNGEGFAFLRVFRVLRPLRSLTMLREMRVLVNTVLKSIPRLFNVTLMGLFIFMVFAIIGITLWGGIFYRQCRSIQEPVLSWHGDCWIWNVTNPDDARLCGGRNDCLSGEYCGGHPDDPVKKYRPKFNGLADGHRGLPWCNNRDKDIFQPKKVFPETDFVHFDHVGGALLLIFQSMTMEGWTDLMYMVQDGSGNLLATAYFFMVILITSFFVLNVILAVIAESFDELTAEDEETHPLEDEESDMDGDDLRARFQRQPTQRTLWRRTWLPCCFGKKNRDPRESHLGVGASAQDIWYDHVITRTAFRIVDSEACKYTILFFIAANVVVMMLDKFPPDLALLGFSSVCEYVFITVFALEMVMMLLAMGPWAYIANPLTCFDGLIVLSSLCELVLTAGSALSILRTFRLLRVVFKIANKWEAFRVLLKSIIKTMFSLGYFALLFLLVMYVLTLMGMSFFAREFHFNEDHDDTLKDGDAPWCPGGGQNVDCIPRAHFDTFPWAFTTIFQIMSGENWNTVMYDAMRAGPALLPAVFFVFMILFGQIMMLNLFLTILMAKFEDASTQLQEEEKERAMERRNRRDEAKRKLKGLHEGFAAGAQALTNASIDEENETKNKTTKNTDSLVSCALAIAESRQNRLRESARLSQVSNNSNSLQVPPEDQKLRVSGRSDVVKGVDDDLEVAHLPGQIVVTPRKSAPNAEDAASRNPERLREEDPSEAVPSLQVVDEVVEVQPLVGPEVQPPPPARELTLPMSTTAPSPEALAGSTSAATLDPQWSVSTLPYTSPTRKDLSADDEWPYTYALLIFSHANPVRVICEKAVARKEFDYFILFCICLSSIIMAIDSPLRDPSDWTTRVMKYGDRFFAIIFIVEMAMKLVALGLFYGPKTYLKSAWNWIDGVVVVVSIIDMTGLTASVGFLKTLRILRAFRPLRVISRNQNLKVVVTTIFESLPELATLFIVAMLFLLIFALLFLAYLNGKFYGCSSTVDPGTAIAMSGTVGSGFVTPLCLSSTPSTSLMACSRGQFDGTSSWTTGTCSSSTTGQLPCAGQSHEWQRISDDTPICVGRCSPLKGPLMSTDSDPPEAICPKKLTRAEELPSVCPHGELNLTAPTPGKYESAERIGISYVKAFQMERILPCGGPIAGVGCRDLFCPHKKGKPASDTCKSECKAHPTFCVTACDKKKGGWEKRKDAKCIDCLSECEAWCECQDYCEPLVEDAALCVEQGYRWGQTISQNFNTIMNSMTTLFEISTTEGWVDVMYEAVDARDYYQQPKRDNAVTWAFAFIVFIFFSNMFIINLSVGVIVDNFIKLKQEARMVNSDGVKIRVSIEGKHYCGRNLAKLKCGTPLNTSNTFDVKVNPSEQELEKGTSLSKPDVTANLSSKPDVMKCESSMRFLGKDSGFKDLCRPEKQCWACKHYTEPCLTQRQAEWVEYQKSLFWLTEPFELTNLHQKPIRQAQAFALISSPLFENTIMCAIILNTLMMACNAFPLPNDWWDDFMIGGGYVFAGVFFVEFVLKFFALRSNYWKDSWNLFDFFCVVATFVGIIINAASDANIGSVMSVIRIFRVARLFRLLRFMKGVNKIFMALVYSLPKLANVSILLVLLLVLYSILGVQLFAKLKFSDTLNVHGNFQNFFFAFMTLFRSMTGEAWNEIMHDLDKEEKDYLNGPRISDSKSWCTPARLFDTDSESVFKVLKDKCLIEHPNQCREYPYFSQLYFVSFTFIIAFSVLNLVIAVILEGYEDGKEHIESEVIDACIKMWKKYDHNYTMYISVWDSFCFADDVLNEFGCGAADSELRVPEIRKSATGFFGVDLACVPMRYAKAFDLQVTENGEVHFLPVVKMVLRIVATKNDPDALAEIEETESRMSQKDREKLKGMEQKQISKNKLDKGNAFGLQTQVAASKIQRRFKARLAKRRALAGMAREYELADASIRAESVATSPSDETPGIADTLGRSAGEMATIISVTREQPPVEGSTPVQALQTLQPRSPANCDGLDEPGRWRQVSLTSGGRQDHSLPPVGGASLREQPPGMMVLNPPPGG